MRYRLLALTIAAVTSTGMAHHASATDINADTQISGTMFFDFTHMGQTDSGQQTAASGTGLDVKRFYLGVTHKFDDVWSANLTTDFNYSASDSETQVFVKKAYVQGAFDKSAVLRVGSADMPWIPFVESYYGYRYVENTLIDRLKEGNSADWGLHLGGNVGDNGTFNYAVSAVDGAGYKNPSRSKNVDFEGRMGWAPVDGMILAVGGYSGKLGKDTEGSTIYNTATRFDFLAAYASKTWRVGAEYFSADNWANVATAYADKTSGWSVWGSVNLDGPWSVFTRYDDAKLSRDIDPQAHDKYFNAGVQYAVNRNFLLSAVFKHEQQDGDPTLSVPVAIPVGVHADRRGNEIGVWGQVKF